MPPFTWDATSLRWFSEFSTYTGFHEKLAEVLRPHVSGSATLCDVGCGAGLVDLYLAGDVGHITCVDQSPEAVGFLRDACAARGIGNITALTADCDTLEGCWDTVLFSFFGTGCLPRFWDRCRRLVSVVGEDDTHGLLPGAPRRHHSAAHLKALLDGQGWDYTVRSLVLEAGQPFRIRAEAEDFAMRYARCTRTEARSFLNARLTPVQDGEFACYLPHAKPVAVFSIRGGVR